MPEDLAEGVDESLIEEALLQHPGLAVTASAHPPSTCDRLFVEYADVLQRLASPDWQVIFGAPGSGKTMLLRLLQERERSQINDEPARDYPHAAVLPVFVNAKDAMIAGMRAADLSADRKAAGYFQLFLERFGYGLVEVVGALKQSRAQRRRVTREVEGIVRDILAIAGDAAPLAPLLDQQIELESGHEESRDRSREGSGALGLGPKSGVAPGVSGQIKSSKARSARQSDKRSATTNIVVPRYTEIKDRLQELARRLRLQRIDILIDNWSALDETGVSELQPAFAQLLAHAFGGTDAISIKVAADRYQTRFHGDGQGLRLEQDIFIAANLNEALLDDDALITFFENVLFNRMNSKVRELSPLIDADRPETVRPEFLLSIFEDRQAFARLVKGCEGRPRQFLLTFNHLARRRGYTARERWSEEHVRDALRHRAVVQSREVEYQTPAVRLLLLRVKPNVLDRHHRVVLLESAVAERLQPFLHELTVKSLLSEKAAEEILPASKAKNLRGFEVTDQVIVEWERAALYLREVQNDAPNEFRNGRLRVKDIDAATLPATNLRDWLDHPSASTERGRANRR